MNNQLSTINYQLSIALLCIVLLGATACGATTTPATPTVSQPDPNSAEGRGAALFSGKGRCSTCHSLAAGTTIVGPSLAGVAISAETRVPELSAAEYLEESIIQPDLYKTPGFGTLQMDVTLAKILTVDEVSDLVAYLLTLKE